MIYERFYTICDNCGLKYEGIYMEDRYSKKEYHIEECICNKRKGFWQKIDGNSCFFTESQLPGFLRKENLDGT